ncbi:Nn.00g084560.m01.CDS01 [Neocucurbitaria sp. VM-36]
MSSIRTTLPIPTQPWEAAKCRFLDGLSLEETTRFKDATLENLFYDASAAQKKHADRSKAWLLQERLSSLVDAIEDYGKALDVFSNTYGLVLSPIWGSLRVVLHIAGEAGKFQERLVGMLAQIGDALPRYRIYQVLFANHERLLLALSDAYLNILKFCVSTKDFFLQAKRSMIPMSIVLKSAWKSFRYDFDLNMVAVRKHSKKVEKEAALAHMIESARSREIELANRALQTKNMRISRRHRILSRLPAVDYVTKHSQKSTLKHAGTTEWLKDTPQYIKWYTSLSSACFYCYGIPGSGKTVLSASLVNSLLEAGARHRDSLVCYYYCDYTEIASLGPMAFMSSLLQQVVQALPLHQFDDELPCDLDNGKCPPSLSECIQYFSNLLKAFKIAYIVIDGINELTPEGQIFALDLIDHLLQPTSIITKIFVTSRIGEYTIHRSLKGHESLKITKGLVDKDIALFISEQIEDMTKHKNSLLNKRGLKQDIIDALVDGANGMFLWVKFQLFDISEALTEYAVRECLRNLPRGLGETYSRIIMKTHNAPAGQAKFDMMQKVFLWVTGARRPLRIDELEEAVGLDKSDTFLRVDCTAHGTGDRLISCCGNLVVLNEDDRTVTFAHHTVRQYLCSSSTGLASSDSSARSPHRSTGFAPFDFSAADSEIGDICLAYLNFTDFETQITRNQETPIIDKSQAEQIVWASVPLPSPIRNIVAWTQGRRGISQGKPETQIKFAMPIFTKPTETLVQKYALLDYVITFWAFHTHRLRADSTNWTKFKCVALYRQLAFEFRPWNEIEHREKLALVLKDLQDSQDDEKHRRPDAAAELELKPKDLLLYSWALRHGISSFLELVNRKSLAPYFQLVSQACELQPSTRTPLYLGKFLDYILTYESPSSGPSGFWRPELIVHCTNECYHQPSDIQHLLEVLKRDFMRWRDARSAAADEMFRSAVILASKLAETYPFRRLMNYYIHTFKSLADIMVAIIQEGNIKSQVAQTLLRHQVRWEITSSRTERHRISPQTEWQLLFALLKLFPVTGWSSFPPGTLSPAYPVMSRLLFIINLVARPRPKTIISYLRVLGEVKDFENLGQPLEDWSSIPLATPEAWDKFQSLVDKDILQEARKLEEVKSQIEAMHDHKTALYRVFEGDLCSYLRQTNTLFSAEAFECDGIHCLEWAVERHHSKLVKVLVPHYVTLMRGEHRTHASTIRRIVSRTRVTKLESLVGLVSLMPDEVYAATAKYLKDTAMTELTALQRKKWISLMVQDRVGDKPAMEWLATSWSDVAGLTKSEWHTIVEIAAMQWRKLISE